jgi:hypothetical protein
VNISVPENIDLMMIGRVVNTALAAMIGNTTPSGFRITFVLGS